MYKRNSREENKEVNESKEEKRINGEREKDRTKCSKRHSDAYIAKNRDLYVSS